MLASDSVTWRSYPEQSNSHAPCTAGPGPPSAAPPTGEAVVIDVDERHARPRLRHCCNGRTVREGKEDTSRHPVTPSGSGLRPASLALRLHKANPQLPPWTRPSPPAHLTVSAVVSRARGAGSVRTCLFHSCVSNGECCAPQAQDAVGEWCAAHASLVSQRTLGAGSDCGLHPGTRPCRAVDCQQDGAATGVQTDGRSHTLVNIHPPEKHVPACLTKVDRAIDMQRKIFHGHQSNCSATVCRMSEVPIADDP
ncbi:hypothetical protein RKD41_000292 [Streptomyces tendae]